jgi:dolichol-phosphate mannosyltransferase
MTTPARVLVTLCTYNERENVQQLVPDIHRFAPQADILVIDDNSPDGTGVLADELAAADPRVHVLHRPGKLGLGTATMAGFQYGIDRGYDLLINMDADFSHPPRYLPALLTGADRADVTIGSRYCLGGAILGWGPVRHIMSRGVNLYARCVLGLSTKDNSGSFRCYRVTRLREVDWSKAKAQGYAIEEEILYRLKRAGTSFTEVPICYEERRHGVTKINWQEALAAGWVMLALRLER